MLTDKIRSLLFLKGGPGLFQRREAESICEFESIMVEEKQVNFGGGTLDRGWVSLSVTEPSIYNCLLSIRKDFHDDLALYID